MYKLVALDLDGSLLNSNHKISRKNKEAVKKCLDRGIKISLLSGREIYSIKKFAEELNAKALLSGYNGSIITDHTGKKVYFKEIIDKSLVEKIIEVNKYKNDLLIVFTEDEIIVDDSETEYYNILKKHTEKKPLVVSDLKKYLKENNKFKNVNKLTLSNDHEDLLKAKKQIDKIVKGELTTLFSLPFYLEVFSKEVSKGLALEKIACHYKIPREKVLAIGDGENDISMINYAGFGIAMENGADKLKAVSDYITLGNNEDGVSLALEKFILN